MTRLQEYTDTLTVLECGNCGVTFGMTTAFVAERRNDHRTWYCPNGHPRHYPAKSENEKLRAELEQAQRQARFARAARDAAQDQADAAERSARAYKGHATRLRNRIANGVCPVAGCRRHFDNVQAHIEGQHPEWAAAHPDALT